MKNHADPINLIARRFIPGLNFAMPQANRYNFNFRPSRFRFGVIASLLVCLFLFTMTNPCLADEAPEQIAEQADVTQPQKPDTQATKKSSEASSSDTKQEEQEEKARPIWLGLRLAAIDGELAKKHGLNDDPKDNIPSQGLLVRNVAKDSPSEKAGLQAGDILLRWNDSALSSLDDLRDVLTDASPGQSVQVESLRLGKVQTLDMTLRARPAKSKLAWQSPNVRGVYVQDEDGKWSLKPLSEVSQAEQVINAQNVAEGHTHTQVWVGATGVASFRVIHEADGQRTEVGPTETGQYEVIRTRQAGEKPGKQVREVYEDAEALKEADPSAYELLSSRRFDVQVSQPAGLTPEQAKDFEAQLRQLQNHLNDLSASGKADPKLQALLRRAMGQLEIQRQAAITGKSIDQLKLELETTKKQIRELQDQNKAAYEFTFDADGRITVVRTKGKDSLTRMFDDEAALEKGWRVAYKRYRELLDEE